MAEQNAEQYGGHDHEFASKIPDRFICQICTKVLRDPHLAVCCGQHFCESCLNKWFTRQGKESCPHCRAEGAAFNHVIHKGLKSEVNQLKIKCSNRGEGCQWTGELGELETHLGSDKGCGYVLIPCPNKCLMVQRRSRDTQGGNVRGILIGILDWEAVACTINRKDFDKHLTQSCYLRPYQCKFCGLKDTYEAITGNSYIDIGRRDEYDYRGHHAKCPEAPLTCPNKCGTGSKEIKRKDMESHRSQCPQEPVECPFAEVGCLKTLKRFELDKHVASSQQKHLSLIMKDYQATKRELHEVKGTLFTAIHLLKQGTEADKQMVDKVISCSMRLVMKNDSVNVLMPNFSKYHHSGKVWHSPPFYYREGHKMCLAVHANGVGKGAGTHVSVTLILLKGENITAQLDESEIRYHRDICKYQSRARLPEGCQWFNVCEYLPLSQFFAESAKELSREETFCFHSYAFSKLVNDCLTINIEYNDKCYLIISVE